MDKTFISKKAKLLRQLQCAICLGTVKDARLCPLCSRFFCKNCIHNWISIKSTSCPNCRATVRYEALVKGCSINEMQESITQLVSCMDRNLCDRHKQHLTLFCYSCEVNICANCWFSPDHADHKERVVPLDEAYEHYRKTLKAALVWVNGTKDLIHEALQQVAENQQQLSSECEQIQTLCDQSAELIAGEASSAALTNILSIVGTITELRSKRQRDTEAIRIDRRGDFMLEPTVLVFTMTEFSQIIQEEEMYDLKVKDTNGFVWKCLVEKDEDAFENDEEEDDNGNDEHEAEEEEEEKDNGNGQGKNVNYCCYLSLLEGKPSEYSVTFYNQPEKVLCFKLKKSVMIGCFKPDINNGTCQVTVEIRQTYTDHIQQLQDRIAQLEKQCANQKSFRNFVSDFEKSMGPASG